MINTESTVLCYPYYLFFRKALYSELIKALPSEEEDFFRTPLTEEERKEAIQSCTRSSLMNYQPPPLNDLTSTAVKKADACLHGIQIELAQATRPIDYYVHRRIQKNPQIMDEYPHIPLASGQPPQGNRASRGTGTTCRTGKKAAHEPRETRRSHCQQEAIEAISNPQVFAGEGVVEEGEGGLSRPRGRVHGRGPPRNVSVNMDQIDGQQVGANYEGFLVKPPTPAGKVAATDTPPIARQKKNNAAANDVLAEEVASLLSKNEIEEVKTRDSGFYSNFFVIPKKTGGLRPVLDLRKMNLHVKERNFKMKSFSSICRLIRRKDFMTNTSDSAVMGEPISTGCSNLDFLSAPTHSSKFFAQY
ncbi:hypothetical protein AYI69_g1690 [Smittium culicis]|uniref:Uncharacterized protein n=1 Tax=Smittium culicis TaxID=133412 RepID=A0A1R1YPJ5_9FUNG|nr:hypothetical protein AYI69_g1690 [Smittium culicis]